MSKECVVAVYDTFEEARDAIRALDDSGVPHDRVSLVTHSVSSESSPKNGAAMQYGDESGRNAAKGAGAGGLLGLLLGSPVLAVSGLGAFIIAGPIGLGLAGAIVGGFLGAMSGWGVHEDHIRRYEAKVAQGDRLVIATGDPKMVALAAQTLQQTEPREMHLHAKDSADTVEP